MNLPSVIASDYFDQELMPFFSIIPEAKHLFVDLRWRWLKAVKEFGIPYEIIVDENGLDCIKLYYQDAFLLRQQLVKLLWSVATVNESRAMRFLYGLNLVEPTTTSTKQWNDLKISVNTFSTLRTSGGVTLYFSTTKEIEEYYDYDVWTWNIENEPNVHTFLQYMDKLVTLRIDYKRQRKKLDNNFFKGRNTAAHRL